MLGYASDAATDVLVLSATGVESETAFAYSGLHQLLRPLLDRIDPLPAPQATALRVALGVEQGEGDLFLVALATLGVLSEAAEAGLLCVVDDLQWLDSATRDVLSFVSRRLDAEPVAILVAVRDPDGEGIGLPGASEVELAGVSADEAAQILTDRRGAPVDPAVARAVAEHTGGNPLALIEVADRLSEDVLQGASALPDLLPIGPGVEAAFADRANALEPDTRLLLLAAAAEQLEPAMLFNVARELGVDPARLEPAELARLITVSDTGVAFRHPLVRSAVYRSASFVGRQRVHLAYAEVFGRSGDDDRAAWHRAAATVGTDDAVAASLDASARRAMSRGVPDAAATAWERAADLSEDRAERGRRLVAAADAAWQAGHAERVPALVDRAERLLTPGPSLARATFIRGRYQSRRGVATTGLALLLDGAATAATEDPDITLDMLMEGMLAALYAGDVAGFSRAGSLAAALPQDQSAERGYYRATLIGIGQVFTDDPAPGITLLRGLGPPPSTVSGWLSAGHAAAYSGAPDWGSHYGRAVEVARTTGSLGDLPYALAMYAGSCRFRGDIDGAVIAATEGLQLAEETGQDADACLCGAELAVCAALRDDADTCTSRAGRVLELAVPRRLRLAGAIATWALALLDLGRGRPEEAARLLAMVREPAGDVGNMAIALFSTADLVEAASRTGQGDLAEAALPGLAGWASSSGMGYARLALARSRALLAVDDSWEEAFLEALAVTEDVPAFERGRTELLYGEALRRARRPAQARAPLRAAVERFDKVGATAWADRARTELRASGESVAQRTLPRPAAVLTPQELQIARMAAAGESNRAIASALFLSPRTVEYHLYKVYPKLGIASRAELARVDLGDRTDQVGPAPERTPDVTSD